MIFIIITLYQSVESGRNYYLQTCNDTLAYEIRTEDAYQDFWEDRHLFDNSDYPEKSKFLDKSN